jgi:aerobic C4-dicarboxylate transport protein
MTKAAATTPRKPWYKVLYIQVLLAIVLGALLGWLFPTFATNDWVRALGDGFIKLIRMVIAPIIFCTVVSGIAHINQVSKVGRVAIKALVYFEIVSVCARHWARRRECAAARRGVHRPGQRRRRRWLRQAS